jgi:hypothetical protein
MTTNTTAGDLLASILATYSTGEREHTRCNIEAGKLSHAYIIARKADGADRATAVAEIAGKLPRASRQTVNQLVGCYHVASLLGEGIDLATVYYYTLRQLIPLLERDGRTETWTILPGIEDAARSLLRDVAEGKTLQLRQPLDAAVKTILANQARTVAEDLARRAEGDPELENQAAEAFERAGKAEAKARKAGRIVGAEARTSRSRSPRRLPADVSTGPMHNPVAAAKHSTPKDLASSLVAQLEANRSPREVLEHLAGLWRWTERDGTAFARGILNAQGGQQAALALCIHVQQKLEEATPSRRMAARVA